VTSRFTSLWLLNVRMELIWRIYIYKYRVRLKRFASELGRFLVTTPIVSAMGRSESFSDDLVRPEAVIGADSQQPAFA
jgi:hypothetical protein